MLMCVRKRHILPDVRTNIGLYCKLVIMQAVVENHCPLINFGEKAETPSNITVSLHALVSVWSGHFHLVKAVFLLVTLFGHHQVVSS